MFKNKALQQPQGKTARLLRVQMALRDVLYISYAIPGVKLLPLVPESLKISTLEGKTAIVSLVIMHCTRVRLSLLPFLRFDYFQFNIRTYVVDPVSGRNAAYFLRSGVTSRLISLTTRSIGIPWELIDIKVVKTCLDGAKSLAVAGNWEGEISLEARAIPPADPVPRFFASTASAVDFLVRPLIGFVGGQRSPRRLAIWHPEVHPERWSLVKLECPVLHKLELSADYPEPHSIFYLPSADFSIFLPPQKII